MVKSKLPPRDGSSLEAVEPHLYKGAMNLKLFFFKKKKKSLSIEFNNFSKTGTGKIPFFKVVFIIFNLHFILLYEQQIK